MMEQKRPHILLADDEAHVLHIMSRRLDAEGYRLTIARNGREALEAARCEPPDLIITDFQMPQMSGLELALALQETPETAGVPIIMLTGRGYTLDREALARTSIQEVRPKPFSAKAIVKLAGEILSERGGGSTYCATRAA